MCVCVCVCVCVCLCVDTYLRLLEEERGGEALAGFINKKGLQLPHHQLLQRHRRVCLEDPQHREIALQLRQYLYFCISKASKLSTWSLSSAALGVSPLGLSLENRLSRTTSFTSCDALLM